MGLEPRPCLGLSSTLFLGENGTGFYRFSVLGPAEGERWQAGPRFSPATTSSRFNAFTRYSGRCLRGAARPGLKPRVYRVRFSEQL